MNVNLADLGFVYQAPLLVLVGFGLALILAEAFLRGKNHASLAGMTVIGCAIAAATAIALYKKASPEPREIMYGMLYVDRVSYFLVALFSGLTALTAMITPSHQREHRWESGEYYGLLVLSCAGMAMLAMAGDLVTIFIGIESMSLAVYVLTASRRRSRRSAEAAMKYFIMGAFATGFLVYGMALIYGATGTTNIQSLQLAVGQTDVAGDPLMVLGVLMTIVAFAFKVAAIPFHMWAPDAYEGAPTPVTAYMAAAVKAAAFGAMLVVFSRGLGGDVMPFGSMGWASPLVVLAALTMTIGNLAALRQDNIKRMLAYSSISHAGVLLVGIAATGLGELEGARAAVLYYLLAYSVTTMGAFAVVGWIGSREREGLHIDDWAGLAGRHPGVALAMTVFMLSLGGIPPTAGFFGKFYVFKAAAQAHDGQLMWLVIVGVLNSAISIFYYLRVVMAMYFRDPVGEIRPIRSGAVIFVIILCAVAVLEMGIMPGYWLGLATL